MRGPAKVKVFTLASVALLSCRAVLGIEDIEEGAADGGGPDAATDSVGTDSATADGGADATPACTADCNVCCREPLKGTTTLPELEKVTKATGCICGDAGACGTQCAAVCTGGGVPGPDCIQCLDNAVITATPPSCGKALNDCQLNSTCKPLGDCLRACKP